MSWMLNIWNTLSSDLCGSNFDILPEEKVNFVLVKFGEEVKILVSDDGVNYDFTPSESIAEVKSIWFEGDKAKYILFEILSELSKYRKHFHEAEFFKTKLKKVYFRYINREMAPYRYSLKSDL